MWGRKRDSNGLQFLTPGGSSGPPPGRFDEAADSPVTWAVGAGLVLFLAGWFLTGDGGMGGSTRLAAAPIDSAGRQALIAGGIPAACLVEVRGDTEAGPGWRMADSCPVQ